MAAERLSDYTRAITRGAVSMAPHPARGIPFTQYVAASLQQRLGGSAEQFLQRCGADPAVARAFHYSHRINFELAQRRANSVNKSAVAVGDTTDANFAGPLNDYQSIVSGFLAELSARTIIGRLQGLRRVPFDQLVTELTTNASGGFVQAGHPVPMSAMSLTSHTMRPLKCSTAIAVSKDLTRSWTTAGETFIKESLLRALQVGMDRAFVDPSVAGDGTTTPISVTATAAAAGYTLTSTGASPAAIANDLDNLAALLIAAGSDLANATWVLHPRSASYLAAQLGSGGAPSFPGMGAAGGTLLGLPALTSTAVPLEVGSPAHTSISLLDPTRIFLADDNMLEIDASEEATVQMLADPATGAQAQTSFFQQSLVGFRCDRYVNWSGAIGSCATLTGVNF